MSAARNAILEKIRHQLDRASKPSTRAEALAYIAEGSHGPIPKRGQLNGEARLAMFQSMAHLVKASTELVANQGEAIKAIGTWSEQNGFARRVAVSSSMNPWSDQLHEAGFQVTSAIPEADGELVLTSAFAGVAETGTLVVTSAPGHPHSLNILAQAHLVVLPVSRLLANYEEAWLQLSQERASAELPRIVLWITGPSRTGDIEQTMQLGAHGPKRLHILLQQDA